MGRIRKLIRIDGRECWTLFDSGSRNTYVLPSVADNLQTSKTDHIFRAAIGGEVKVSNRSALLEAEVEGHPISTHAMIVDSIGLDEDGKAIEILFGALSMQQWGIRLIPEEEKIDLTHYPREFLEFGSFPLQRPA